MRCFHSLLPALQESPPGGESETPGSDEGNWHMSPPHIVLVHATSFKEECHTYTHTMHKYTVHVRCSDIYVPLLYMYVTHWYTLRIQHTD